MKLQSVFLLIIIFSLTACSTDAELAFQDWDEDKDGIITQAEYNQMKPYSDLFDQWDENSDNLVSEEEWRRGVNYFYTDADESDYGNFREWDIDDDGHITSNEFAQKTFYLWDEDKDNALTYEEFQTWYP